MFKSVQVDLYGGILWFSLLVSLPSTSLFRRMMKDCFVDYNIHRTFHRKETKFFIFGWTHPLQGGPLICDITNSLEVNPGQIFSVYTHDVKTWSLSWNNLTSENGDILCPAERISINLIFQQEWRPFKEFNLVLFTLQNQVGPLILSSPKHDIQCYNILLNNWSRWGLTT